IVASTTALVTWSSSSVATPSGHQIRPDWLQRSGETCVSDMAPHLWPSRHIARAAATQFRMRGIAAHIRREMPAAYAFRILAGACAQPETGNRRTATVSRDGIGGRGLHRMHAGRSGDGEEPQFVAQHRILLRQF